MADNFKNVGTVIGGDGDPANGDGLCTNLSLFPINSVYVNNSTGKVFTRDAASGVAADWVSQSGGSSLLQTATVTLTDAQIKALPTTGVNIVDAPGENKFIDVQSVLIVSNFVSIYTNITGASFSILNGEGADIGLALPAETILGSTTRQTAKLTTPLVFNGSVAFDGVFITQPVVNTGTVNQPIVLKDYFNGVSNYTGGNAANTLKVTVYYVVVDL